MFTRITLENAKVGEDLIFTGRLFFLVCGMFLKIDFIPLQGDAMSGRVEWQGQKPYCIWPLSGVQTVEAQRDKQQAKK